MNIAERLLAPFRRGGGGVSAGTVEQGRRRTTALPAIYRTRSTNGDVLPKRSPENLRRLAELPIPRKAINTIKDRIAGMRWRIQVRSGRTEVAEDTAQRIEMLTRMFEHPNPDDSFRSMSEQVLEDVIVGGFGALELQATGNSVQPLHLWPVDGATIRLRADWNGDPAAARYVQDTRYGGTPLELADRELSYIRLNPRTHTPFGGTPG